MGIVPLPDSPIHQILSDMWAFELYMPYQLQGMQARSRLTTAHHTGFWVFDTA